MDSKVDLSKLTCGLCASCCQISTHTFTSLQGQGNLAYNEILLSPLSFLVLAQILKDSRVISALSCECLAFLPELPFPKMQSFSSSVFAELISHLTFLDVFLMPKSLHPEGHWSDALRVSSNIWLYVRVMLNLTLIWYQEQPVCFSPLLIQP